VNKDKQYWRKNHLSDMQGGGNTGVNSRLYLVGYIGGEKGLLCMGTLRVGFIHKIEGLCNEIPYAV
jgi:hypothetical protein